MLNLITQLPTEMIEALKVRFGDILLLEGMGGINQSEVIKINLARGVVIAKKVAHIREIEFYKFVAPKLRNISIQTPMLEWVSSKPDNLWFAMEYIPNPLPEHRWEADKEVIQYLAKLHSVKKCDEIKSPYIPVWTKEMNLKALECVDPAFHKTIFETLENVRSESDFLFEEHCLIAGDPNPHNWALRTDGGLVQYDWQKVGLGTPALDLAVIICSSEDHETSLQVAKLYLECGGGKNLVKNITSKELANQILKACVWNYVRFLNNYIKGRLNVPEKIIDHIAENFPSWLCSQVKIIAA